MPYNSGVLFDKISIERWGIGSLCVVAFFFPNSVKTSLSFYQSLDHMGFITGMEMHVVSGIQVSMVSGLFLASVEKARGISFVDVKQCYFPIDMQQRFTVGSVEHFCILNVSWISVYF